MKLRVVISLKICFIITVLNVVHIEYFSEVLFKFLYKITGRKRYIIVILTCKIMTLLIGYNILDITNELFSEI